jgi:SAM-dependent methyltransferase
MVTSFDADAFREFDRRGHDRLASQYVDGFASITALAIPGLLAAACVKRDSKVLDVACGPGMVCAAAELRGAVAVGVDLSSGMIAVAQRLHPRTEFRLADVEHLPFVDNQFDAVVCNFGLGHFPRPERCVAECARVLKSDGRLAFAWWDSLQKQRLQAIFREALQRSGARPPPETPTGHDTFRFSDTKALHALLQGADLRSIDIEDVATSIDVKDAEELWKIGIGGLAVTSSIILGVEEHTRKAIRHVFDSIAEIYRQGTILRIPIAFKIASGSKT